MFFIHVTYSDMFLIMQVLFRNLMNSVRSSEIFCPVFLPNYYGPNRIVYAKTVPLIIAPTLKTLKRTKSLILMYKKQNFSPGGLLIGNLLKRRRVRVEKATGVSCLLSGGEGLLSWCDTLGGNGLK